MSGEQSVETIEAALREVFLHHFGQINRSAARAAMSIVDNLPKASNVPLYYILLPGEEYHEEMLIVVVVIGDQPLWNIMPAAQFRERET